MEVKTERYKLAKRLERRHRDDIAAGRHMLMVGLALLGLLELTIIIGLLAQRVG